MPDSDPPIRLALVQLIVPHYRVPVFDRLAQAPGIDLTVLTDAHQPEGSLESVPQRGSFRFEHHPWRRRGPFVSHPVLLSAVRSGRFDAVIAPWNTRLLQLFPALLAARRRGVRMLLFGHGYSKREGALRRRLRNLALRLADGAILYSAPAAARLAAEGLPRAKLFVAPNAIDQSRIDAARRSWLARPDDLAAFQRERRIVPGDLVVFVSRLEPDKRVDLLLRAFALLRTRRPRARLAVVGKGSQLDPLRALAAELGLADAVDFPGAIYEEEALAPWMLSAGCFAYPVAIGLSILHAFGYGLPVVTSDDIAGHNPEIDALRPQENGLLYRDGDLEDFAATMESCLADPERRRTLGAGALATVHGPQGYSIDTMVAGFVAAARSAVGRGV